MFAIKKMKIWVLKKKLDWTFYREISKEQNGTMMMLKNYPMELLKRTILIWLRKSEQVPLLEIIIIRLTICNIRL